MGRVGAGRAAVADRLPVHTSHPLFVENKVRFFVDPWPWIEDLRGVDFAFGTRIHGNIAALLAGTPAFVLAHDSRTLELARYFEIPHRRMTDVPPDTDAAELYAEADYGALMRGHAARFATFSAFLARHGLSTCSPKARTPRVRPARRRDRTIRRRSTPATATRRARWAGGSDAWTSGHAGPAGSAGTG